MPEVWWEELFLMMGDEGLKVPLLSYLVYFPFLLPKQFLSLPSSAPFTRPYKFCMKGTARKSRKGNT